MNDITIWVEGFSARYCIGQRERDNALRDVLTDAFTSPFRRLWGNSQSGHTPFRRLKTTDRKSTDQGPVVSGQWSVVQWSLRPRGQ